MIYKTSILFIIIFFVLTSKNLSANENLLLDFDFNHQWNTNFEEKVHGSRVMIRTIDGQAAVLGITAGRDRKGEWSTEIKQCEVGNRYRFEAEFLRENRFNLRAYPQVRIWGRLFTLNTHRKTGKYQKLWIELDCPNGDGQKSSNFSFISNYPGTTFWLKNPRLFQVNYENEYQVGIQKEEFFPIGIYGVNGRDLDDISSIGLNTSVMMLSEESLLACLSRNIHCSLVVPREFKKLLKTLKTLKPLILKGRFSFYVNDEPGIHSFPREKADKIQQILKDHFPNSFTHMAIVRPWVIPEYQLAADYFMLDQYPIPHMPMTWLSDSMDEAAEHVGRKRLQSVIQAFGGEKWASNGWSRFPTFEEMTNLAFLSVIHGSRGIYFFTYPEIAASDESLEDFKKVIKKLNSLRSWLLVHNDREKVGVEMVSDYKYGPKGKPAVHCTRKEQYNTQMLICVNVLRTYVEAEVDVNPFRSPHWENYFTGEMDYVVDGNILGRFEPLEVKVWMEQK